MKNINLKCFVAVACLGVLFSCDNDLESINENPNAPEVVPTSSIFASATRQAVQVSRGSFTSGRLTLPWMQYWGQNAYADEDRYQPRQTTIEDVFELTYRAGQNFKAIIDLNSDEETRLEAALSGNNENQIAASRVMLSSIFFELTNYYGDVPYYSFGSDDPDFQALDINSTFNPAFASSQKIYTDILSELRAAADQFVVSEPVFTTGDNVFNGDASKWKKFANSLILRVAYNLRNGVDDAAADAAIAAALADGVMTSNEDTAAQAYSTSDATDLSSPFWIAFIARTDFAVAAPFVQLLKGERGGFSLDPRLFEMVAPFDADIEDIKSDSYERSENPDDYVGVPYAFVSANFLPFTTYSFASSNVIRPDYSEVFMEYAEVAFLQSEFDGFSQEEYENGVRGSMERWGVEAGAINDYIATLPPANAANVQNQRYIALYMQPNTAYTYYRKSGFPNTLVGVGEIYTLPAIQVDALSEENKIESYGFEPIPDIDDLPSRLTYPIILQTLNGENRQGAVSSLDGGDVITGKLFWDNN